MKKKPITEPVISPEIMEMAKKSLTEERPALKRSCAVCGAAGSSTLIGQADDETLCWICRRLKISAWRDSDQQIAAQE